MKKLEIIRKCLWLYFFNVFNYSIATSDRHLVYPNTFVHVIVIFSNSFNRQAHIVVFIFVCNTDCKNVAATVYFLNHDSFTKCQHKFFLELQHLHSCTVWPFRCMQSNALMLKMLIWLYIKLWEGSVVRWPTLFADGKHVTHLPISSVFNMLWAGG